MDDEDKIEKEFLNAIDGILFWALKDKEEDKMLKENSYDLPCFLENVKIAIERFNTLYHIVSVTKGWAQKK